MMSVRTVLRRLLEALILAGLAGAIAYGITAWFAPPSISPIWAAAIIATAAALAIILPAGVFDTPGQREGSSGSAPDTYYDYSSSADKDESWGN